MNVISDTLELVGAEFVDTTAAGGDVVYIDVLDAADAEPDWQERALCAQTDPEAFFLRRWIDAGGQADLFRVRGPGRVPGVRARTGRAVRDLGGRPVGAGTPQTASRRG